MGSITRFGVSLDSELLNRFDAFWAERGSPNRSEAIRDLIRTALVAREWEESSALAAATVTLVYDHHKTGLARKITGIQHDAHHLIITTMHVHLDHHNCLEVLVLKGPPGELKALAERLVSTKGVVFGSLSFATTGENLC